MRITTTKGKSVNVKDSVIQKYMNDFSLTKEDAIQMYLEDEGFENNEDVEEMTAKAKENKAVMHGESADKDERKVTNKKQSKPKTEYRLYNNDGSFWTITKTEFDFALFLMNKN